MSSAEEDRKRAARAERVALFRYQLIREAADPALTVRQRGRLVRELAARAHEGPSGEPVAVSRATIDRWIRAWRSGGFAALAPPARQVMLRTDAAVLELAAGLKREKPERTAAQVMRILRTTCGWSPSVRTLQRHFERLELTARPDGRPPAVFGRFECARPNEMWTGDVLCLRRHKTSSGSPFSRSSAGQSHDTSDRTNGNFGAMTSTNVGYLPRTAPLRWRAQRRLMRTPFLCRQPLRNANEPVLAWS